MDGLSVICVIKETFVFHLNLMKIGEHIDNYTTSLIFIEFK